MNVVTKKFATKKLAMTAATIMLALGVTTIQVQQAEARNGGRIIAGAIAGAALLAIIGSERARGHHSHRRHEGRRYHIHHDKWGDPYRCYRKHGPRRQHWRNKHRRHHDNW